MSLLRYHGTEGQYVTPVIDGLKRLEIPLPAPIADALRVHTALAARQEQIHADASTSSVPALRQQLVDALLAAAGGGEPVTGLADKIADAMRGDEVRAIERLALEQALERAAAVLPPRIAGSAPAIERALAKKLNKVMAGVREVADVAHTMPLADPSEAVRQASDEQLRAFQVVSKAVDEVSTIRDLQRRLRYAQNAADADRAVAEYADPAVARSAPKGALEAVVWMATEAKPVVRGPEEIAAYIAAQPSSFNPALRGVKVEVIGGAH